MTRQGDLDVMTSSRTPQNPRWRPLRLATIAPWLLVLAVPLQAQEKPQLAFDGLLYLRYSYQLGTDSTFGTNAHGNNFDLDRAYLTVRAKLSHGVSTRVTTDIDPSRSTTNQLPIVLKYAYVAWQPEGSALTWKFGEIQTPLIDWLEALWGIRLQGTMALSRARYVNASDFGASVSGAWHDDGVNFTAGLYNGEGFNRRPGDQHKDAAARASVRLMGSDASGPTGGLRLTGFAHLGASNGGGTRQRYTGVLSWQSSHLTLAAEATVTQDSTATDAPHTRGRVFSAYGTYTPTASPLTLLARLDRWDPDIDRERTVPDLTVNRQNRIIAGVAYRATPQLRLLLDADLASAHHGSPNNAYEASRRTLQFHTEVRF